ncbi:magnesium transporter CorA family protein [Williamsia sterculiae]|uniref:Magnesium transporter n=1 Tax=Williamsia sterculiae TaxID=1344003 RepID=A0A1N7FCY2_9NOCA|nr:magnesium transporter CorA family protein [Williamsia sterculiae]SIR98173.1 magnesium transporter [Williamsia sterculiae]
MWQNGTPVDGFDLSKVSDCIDDPTRLIWADLTDPSHELLERLGDELGLSPWAIEDVVADAERVKASVYHNHLMLTLYAVRCDTDAADGESGLHLNRISVFVRGNALITIHRDSFFDMQSVVDRWAEIDMQRYGIGALLHGLLDVIVDDQFDAVQTLDEQIENLETLLFDQSSRTVSLQRRTYALRKDLVQLRRVVLPMREVIGTIERRRLAGTSPKELDPMWSDLYDHTLRAAEWTESLRDMVTTVFETNLSLQDARLNTVMKKLTGWAGIIAVPTAITGFFGQNVPYPGYSHVSGFVASTVLIIVMMVGLYLVFRRRDWL